MRRSKQEGWKRREAAAGKPPGLPEQVGEPNRGSAGGTSASGAASVRAADPPAPVVSPRSAGKETPGSARHAKAKGQLGQGGLSSPPLRLLSRRALIHSLSSTEKSKLGICWGFTSIRGAPWLGAAPPRGKRTYLRLQQPALVRLASGCPRVLECGIKRDFVLGAVEGCKARLPVVLLTDLHVERLGESFRWDSAGEEHVTLGKAGFVLADDSAQGKAREKRQAEQTQR